VDAISYLGLGQVFSAIMSGNFIFLGFRIAGADGPSVPAVISALAGFGVGAFLGGRIVRQTKDSGALWPRRVTVALGTTLVAEAAFLALWIGVDAAPCRDRPTCCSRSCRSRWAFSQRRSIRSGFEA
jgi:uncharacterized membrane protein YoaK (UPF0700 family)